MPKSVYFLFFLLFGLFESIAVANDSDVKKSQWNGFERHDFKYKGVKSLLVIPDSPAKVIPGYGELDFLVISLKLILNY